VKIDPLAVPRHTTETWRRREMATITTLVVHHTGARAVVKDTEPYLRATSRWIIGKYDWPSIPYHFAVGQDGRVYLLNDCTAITYHAGDWQVNTCSIGLVLVGNFTRMDPPEPQLTAAAELCRLLCRRVLPHSKIVPTACPGRWERWGHVLAAPVLSHHTAPAGGDPRPPGAPRGQK
jgi:hypothetical protein